MGCVTVVFWGLWVGKFPELFQHQPSSIHTPQDPEDCEPGDLIFYEAGFTANKFRL